MNIGIPVFSKKDYIALAWLDKSGLCKQGTAGSISDKIFGISNLLHTVLASSSSIWRTKQTVSKMITTNFRILYERGRKVIGISGSPIWSKTLMELIINPCGEFRWSPEVQVSQIHSPHLLVGAPRIFADLLKFVQMLKREWGAESNGKLPHLFIPNKTATYVPEFAMEDLPLSRIAALVPKFAMKDLPPCAEHWWWWWWWWV